MISLILTFNTSKSFYEKYKEKLNRESRYKELFKICSLTKNTISN